MGGRLGRRGTGRGRLLWVLCLSGVVVGAGVGNENGSSEASVAGGVAGVKAQRYDSCAGMGQEVRFSIPVGEEAMSRLRAIAGIAIGLASLCRRL